MKIFITKHALTEGIVEKEAEGTVSLTSVMIRSGSHFNFFHKGEYFEDFESAKADAEKRRTKKIESLKYGIKSNT